MEEEGRKEEKVLASEREAKKEEPAAAEAEPLLLQHTVRHTVRQEL